LHQVTRIYLENYKEVTMNKKAQIELDSETILAAVMGIVGGLSALFVMKGSPSNGIFLKIATFAISSIVCFIVAKFVLSR